jgi:hypothetical protein
MPVREKFNKQMDKREKKYGKWPSDGTGQRDNFRRPTSHTFLDKNFHLSYGRQSGERRTSEMSKGSASNRASGTVGQAPSIDRKEYIRSYIYPTHRAELKWPNTMRLRGK